MPGDTGKYHRICEYLKYTPKAFSTWLSAATILNPYTPPLPLSLFIHLFLASITKVYITLFITYVVDPLFSDIRKLTSSPIPPPPPTPRSIHTLFSETLSIPHKIPHLNPESSSSLSPSIWKIQPFNRPSSYTNTSKHNPPPIPHFYYWPCGVCEWQHVPLLSFTLLKMALQCHHDML